MKQGDLSEAISAFEATDEGLDEEGCEKGLVSGYTSRVDRIYKWIACREGEKSGAQG